MSDNVVDIRTNKPEWMVGLVKYLDCGYKWTAVVHMKRLAELECPKCGKMKGFTYEVSIGGECDIDNGGACG